MDNNNPNDPTKVSPSNGENGILNGSPTQADTSVDASTDKTLDGSSSGILKGSDSKSFFNTPKSGVKAFGINRELYEPYMNEVRANINPEHLNKLRAENQSSGEKWLGFGTQLLAEVVGGTISAIGSMPELAEAVYSELNNGDADFNNWMMQLGDDIIKGSKELAPIHRRNEGKTWDVSDLGWWLNNGVSVGSSLSMMVPGFGAMKGLSALGKLGTALSKGTKAGSTMNKALNATEHLTATQKNLAKLATSAVVMRNAENMRESLGIVNDLKKESIALFKDDKKYNEILNSEVGKEFMAEGREVNKENLADFIAAKAAWKSYAINSANIVFDFFQSRALLGANAFSRNPKLTKKTYDALYGKAVSKSDKLKRAVKLYGDDIFEVGSEGIEESVNFIGGEEGKQHGKELLKTTKEKSFFDTVKKSVADGHMWEAAFFGVIGGGVFQGAGKAVNKLTGKEGASYDDMIINELENRNTAITKYNSEMIAAAVKEEEGKTHPAIIAQDRKKAEAHLVLSLALNAAQTKNTEHLLEKLNSPEYQQMFIQNMTVEQQKNAGYQNLSDKIENIKSQIIKAEQDYNHASNLFANRAGSPASRHQLTNTYVKQQYANRIHEQSITDMDNQIASVLNDDAVYQEAINSGKEIDTAIQLQLLEENRRRRSEIITKLGDDYKHIQEEKDLLAFYENKIKETKELVIDTVPSTKGVAYKAFKDFYQNKYENEHYLAQGKENINKLINPTKYAELASKIEAKNKAKQTALKEAKKLQYQKSVEKSLENKSLDEQEIIINNELKDRSNKNTDKEDNSVSKEIDKANNSWLTKKLAEIKDAKTEKELSEPLTPDSTENQGEQTADSLESNDESKSPTDSMVYEGIKKYDKYSNKTHGEVTVLEFKERKNGVVDVHFRKGTEILTATVPDFKRRFKPVVTNVVSTLKDKLSSTDTTTSSDILTLNDLLNELPNNESNVGLKELASKLNVDVRINDSNEEAFMTEIHNDGTYTIEIAPTKITDDIDIAEAIAHELTHVALEDLYNSLGEHKDSVTETIEDIVNEIVIPKGMETSDAKYLLDIIKDNPIDEFFPYANTNTAIMELLLHKQNKEALDILNMLIDTFNDVPLMQSIKAFKTTVEIAKKPSRKVAYKATPNAKKLIKLHGLNPYEITPTGKNGDILVKDVKSYMSKNKITKTIDEFVKDNNIQDNTKITGETFNIFIAYLNNEAINPETYQIDASHYNKRMKEEADSKGWYFKPVTQSELEAIIKVIISPDFGVHDSLEIKRGKSGAFQILHDNLTIGWLNNPKKTQETIDYIDKLLNAKTIEEVKAIQPANKGQRSWFNMRLNEVSKGKNINKSLKSQRERIAKSREAELSMIAQYEAAKSKNPDATVYVNITRKTSGNLEKNAEPVPVSSEFSNITDVWFKKPDESGNILYNGKGDKRHKAKHATRFFDHNANYTVGVGYIMLPGANAIPGEMDTHIPMSIDMALGTTKIAGESTDNVLEYAKLANKLLQAGRKANPSKKDFITDEYRISQMSDEDKANNEAIGKLLELQEKLRDFYPIKRGKDNEGNLKDNTIEFYPDNMLITFNYKGERNELKVVYRQKSGEVYFTVHNKTKGERTMLDSALKPEVEVLNSDGEIIMEKPKVKGYGMKVGGTTAPKQLAAIKQTLNGVFKRKQTSINLTRDNTVPYRDGKTYREWMIKQNLVLTNSRSIKGIDGKPIKDERGNPITAQSSKYNNKSKNSNLIIGVGTNIQSQSQKAEAISRGKFKVNKFTGENKKAVEKLNKEHEKVAKKIDNTILSYNEKLMDKGSFNVSLEDMTNEEITQLVKDLQDLQTNHTLIEVEPKGEKTFKIKRTYIDPSNLGTSVGRKKKKKKKRRTKLVQEGDDKKVTINEKEAKEWWKATFGDNVELDMNVAKIINVNGVDAWGVFEDAMVKLSKSSPAGTEYHEAFHAVFWLYLDDAGRTTILNEAKDKYGDIGLVALEELVADEFMDYVMKDGNTNRQDNSEATKNFFQKILNWIKTFFNKYYNNESKTDKLFRDINSGKFNYAPDQRMIEYAKKISRTKPVDGLTRNEELESIGIIGKMLIEYYDENSGESVKDIVKGGGLKSQIRANLLYTTTLKDENGNSLLDEESIENIKRITTPNTFDALWVKSVIRVKREFDIKFDDNLLSNDLKELKKAWDDSAAFKESGKSNINSLIKRIIMTTPSEYAGDFLGLDEYLEFNKVYPYIQRIMVGASSITEMMNRLKAAAEFDTTMASIADKIESDERYMSAWYSQFRKQVPIKKFILIDSDGIKVDQSNKAASHYVLSNMWVDNVKQKMEQGYFTDDIKAEINQAGSNGIQELIEGNLDEGAELLSKAYNHLGINISPDNIIKITELDNLNAKYNSKEELIKDIFDKPLLASNYDIAKAAKGKEAKFNNTGTFNKLAAIASLFQYDLMENSSFDVMGNNVFSVQNPDFLSLFMEKFHALRSDNYIQQDIDGAKQEMVDFLKNVARQPDMKYSNWLWAMDGINGFLLPLNGKRDADSITVDSLNLPYFDKFNYSLLDGIKNNNSVEGAQYNSMTDNDWDFTTLAMFFGGTKNKEGDNIRFNTFLTPIPIPADAGNIKFIESGKFEANHDGTVTKGTPLYEALKRSAKQDYYRAVAARDLMFDVDSNYKVTVKKELDTNNLVFGYHYTEINKDGTPKLLTNGKPNGRIFDSFLVVDMENTGYHKGIPIIGLPQVGTKAEAKFEEDIDAILETYIQDRIDTSLETFKKYREHIETIKGFNDNYEGDTGWNKFIAEFTLNSSIAYMEQFNFFIGSHAYYKHAKDSNKRSKEIVSPGNSLSGTIKESFNAVTLTDRELGSTVYTELITSVTKAFKKEAKYKKMRVNKDNLVKGAERNALEEAVYRVLNSYANINTGDAQGYITVDRYEDIMRGLGRLDSRMRSIIQNIRNGRTLTANQLDEIMNPLKGFNFGNDYDASLNLFVPNQIKYSTVPLIPQLIKGTQLEQLSDFMIKNNIDEAFFESAHKVGKRRTINIFKPNGDIDQKALDKFSNNEDGTNSYVQSYSNDNWRLQLDMPDHIVDTENKLGTQIAKIIISNINPNTDYTLNGKTIKGKKLVDDYMDIMSTNIEEDAMNLLERMGIEEQTDALGIQRMVITDINKIQRVLMDEVESRGISENYANALTLVEGDKGMEFNMPLFINAMSNKWESILSSLFTNNVTNQKQPGGSAVVFSSAFVTDSDISKDTEIKDDSSIENIQSIEWLKDKKHELTFKVINGVIHADVLLPRTSKNMFDNDGTPISIDKIKETAPNLLKQIWYRIPYEKKASSMVVNVVGFLPSSSGNTIILPIEAIAMSGEDMDGDKRFGMYRESYKDNNGNTRDYKYYETHREKGAFEQWLSSRQAKKLRKLVQSNPTEAMKKLRTQVKRFSTYSKNLSETTKSLYNESSTLHTEAMTRLISAFNEKFEVNVLNKQELYAEVNAIFDSISEAIQDINLIIDEEKKEGRIPKERFDELVSIQKDYIEQSKTLEHNIQNINFEFEGTFNIKKEADEFKEYRDKIKAARNKYNKLYQEATNKELIADFNSTPIKEVNGRKGRNNRIQSIMEAILTNPNHLIENLTPSAFDDGTAVIDELKPILNESTNVNAFTPEGQRFFRKQNIDGRALKGMAADSNAFLPIAQKVGMKLRKDLAFIHKVQLGDKYNKKDLIKKYGKDNVVFSNNSSNFILDKNIKDSNIDEVADPVEKAIYERLQYSKIKTESFKRYGDRNRIKDGDALKWISNNGEALDVAAQEMTNDLGITIEPQDFIDFIDKYKSRTDYINQHKQKYVELHGNGKEYAKSNKDFNNYAYIRLSNFAFNENGTFTNLNDDVTTNHTSQILAQILDIVKEGIPPNVNTYTFYTYVTMMNIGLPMRDASMFIRQPILKDLTDYYMSKQSILENGTGNEISELKAVYEARLFTALYGKDVKAIEGFSKGQVRSWTSMANRGKLFLPKEVKDKVLGTITNINHDADNITGAFTVDELKAMIVKGTKPEANKDVDYLRNQLLIAEKFIKYKEMGEAYSDITKALSQDRKSVGPSISNTIAMDKHIEFIRHYGGEGARVLATVDGRTMPAVNAVFVRPDDTHESQYSVLNSYYQYGNKLGFETISPFFIKYSPAVLALSDTLFDTIQSKFDPKIFSKFGDFVKVYLLKDLSYLQMTNDERRQLLGIDKYDTDLIDSTVSIDEFKKLSVAHKLAILKDKHKDELENDSHILNYLSPKLSIRDVRRTGFHTISFLNTTTDSITDDHLVDSFEEMWDSNDEYMKDLADSLIKYSYITNGFTMKKDSFSKIIPTRIYKEIGIDVFLNRKLEDFQDPSSIDADTSDTIIDLFIKNNTNNSKIVPTVNISTNKHMELWNRDSNTNIITVDPTQYESINERLTNSKYLNIPITIKKGEGRGSEIITINHQIYEWVQNKLVPVNKLGNNRIIEFGQKSIVTGNNVAVSEDMYKMYAVGNLSTVNPITLNTIPDTFTNTLSHHVIWKQATNYIGQSLNDYKAGVEGGYDTNQFRKAAADMLVNPIKAGDKVFLHAQSRSKDYGAGNFRNDVFTDNNATEIKKDSPYRAAYTALNREAVLMLPSRYDDNGNPLKNFEYNEKQMGANSWLIHHFETLAEKSDIHIMHENGVMYVAKNVNIMRNVMKNC